jgi:hypothetical protein
MARKRPDTINDKSDIKFVKTKERSKLLMCHIIGITMHLAWYNRIRASILGRALKKEIGELKNFFKEIGLTMEASKNMKTGEPDLMLYLHSKQKQQELEKENPELFEDQALIHRERA